MNSQHRHTDGQTGPEQSRTQEADGEANQLGTGTEPTDITHLPECEPPARKPGQRGRLAGTGATAHLLERQPPKMTEAIITTIRRARKAGLTERETRKILREDFGVSTVNWFDWKCHPKWGERLRKAMALEDDPMSARIEETLAERALGSLVWREHLDSKTGMVHKLRQKLPPDVAAAELWLTNRRNERWKSRVESGGSGLTVVINSPMIAQALGMSGPVSAAVEHAPDDSPKLSPPDGEKP